MLREPATIALPDGPRELTELRFYADDARAVVEAAGADRGPRDSLTD